MQLLIIVILLNTFIFTAFKLFGNFRINSLQAIAVNYWTCVVTGFFTHSYHPFTTSLLQESWATHALILGAYFIFLFNFLSYSTAKLGMTATTIPNKLSLVIPVLFSWWLYNDDMGWVKVIGLLLAIPAVYLANKKDHSTQPANLWLPFTVFITSGLLDTYIKYVQHHNLSSADDQSHFTITTFMIAAALGSTVAIVRIINRRDSFAMKNVWAGIFLGIPNYFSIYYLIRLLDSDLMQSSSIIPVNNIGIVVSTTLVAVFLFREQAGRQRLAGVALAIISIILIALAGQ